MATTDKPAVVTDFCNSFNVGHEPSIMDSDGTVYGSSRGAIALCADDVTRFGNAEFSESVDAQYDRTETFEFDTKATRAYVFTHEYGETAINVKYVRTLANDVFDCSYDTLKANAHAFDPEVVDPQYETYSLIRFTLPESDYSVVVGPLVTENTA